MTVLVFKSSTHRDESDTREFLRRRLLKLSASVVRTLQVVFERGTTTCRAPRETGFKTPRHVTSELEAISSYAQFVAEHPDMPPYHRERLLSQIRKCSERAKSGLR